MRKDTSREEEIKFSSNLEEVDMSLAPGRIDFDDVKKIICQDSKCKDNALKIGKKIHRHTVESCKPHLFCIAESLDFRQPIETKINYPLATGNYKLTADHRSRLMANEFGADGPVPQGTKLVVTKYAHDKWLAQMFGLDLENFPSHSSKIPKQVLDHLRCYIPKTSPQKKERLQETSDSEEEQQEQVKKENKAKFIAAKMPQTYEEIGDCMKKAKVTVFPERKQVLKYVDMLERDNDFIIRQQNELNNGKAFDQSQLFKIKSQMSSAVLEANEDKKIEMRNKSIRSLLRPDAELARAQRSKQLEFMTRVEIETCVKRRQAYVKRLDQMHAREEAEERRKQQELLRTEDESAIAKAKQQYLAKIKSSQSNNESQPLTSRNAPDQQTLQPKNAKSSILITSPLQDKMSQCMTQGRRNINVLSDTEIRNARQVRCKSANRKGGHPSFANKLTSASTPGHNNRYNGVKVKDFLRDKGDTPDFSGIGFNFNRNSPVFTDRHERDLHEDMRMINCASDAQSINEKRKGQFGTLSPDVYTSLLDSACKEMEHIWTHRQVGTMVDVDHKSTTNASTIRPKAGVPAMCTRTMEYERKQECAEATKALYSPGRKKSPQIGKYEKNLMYYKSPISNRNNKIELGKEHEQPPKACGLHTQLVKILKGNNKTSTLNARRVSPRKKQTDTILEDNQSEVISTQTKIQRLVKSFGDNKFSDMDSDEEEQCQRQQEEEDMGKSALQLKMKSSFLKKTKEKLGQKVIFKNGMAKKKKRKVPPPNFEQQQNKTGHQVMSKRKILQMVVHRLNNEIDEKPCFDKFLQVNLPDYHMTAEELRFLINDMEGPHFWLKKAQDANDQGKLDFCVAYYLNGLRLNPSSTMLMYNLANCYKKLGKLKNAKEWFTIGVQLQHRWVDGQVGLAMTQFQMGDFEDALLNVEQAVADFDAYEKMTKIRTDLFKPLYSVQNLSIFLATVHKCKGTNKEAAVIYREWMPKLKENQGIADCFFSMLFVPLMPDKKLLLSQLQNMWNYFEVMTDETKVSDRHLFMRISQYTIKGDDTPDIIAAQDNQIPNGESSEPRLLNWEKYPETLKHIFCTKHFFRRFSAEQLVKHLKDAKVQVYKKNALVFNEKRITIVLSGSIHIKRHPMENLGEPIFMQKAMEGDILGFNEGDDGQTNDPLTWMVTYSSVTEVLVMEKDDFLKLWDLQKADINRQLILRFFDNNCMFKCMSPISRYSLVYECVTEEIWYPGEQIVSIEERSPLCKEFCELYKDNVNSIKQRIEQKQLTRQDKEQFVAISRKKVEALGASPKKTQQNQRKKPEERVELTEMHDQMTFLPVQRDGVKKKVLCDKFRCGLHMKIPGKKRYAVKHNIQYEEINNKSEHLNWLERLIKADYAYQKKQKEAFMAKESERFEIRKRKDQRENFLSTLCRSSSESGHDNHRNTLSKGSSKNIKFGMTFNQKITGHEDADSEDEIDKMDPRRGVTSLFFEKMLVSIHKAYSDKRELSLVLKIANGFETRYKIAKELNKRLQEESKVLLQTPNHQKMPCVTDLLEMVDQIRRSIFIIMKGIKKNILANGLKNDYFDQQKQMFAKLVQMQNMIASDQGVRRIPADGIHFIAEGEAILTQAPGNEDFHMPELVLTSGQFFGQSEISRQASVNYFGDIRAYMQPLKTYKICYQEIYRVLNFTELAKIRATKIKTTQFTTGLNVISHQFEIDPTAFDKF